MTTTTPTRRPLQPAFSPAAAALTALASATLCIAGPVFAQMPSPASSAQVPAPATPQPPAWAALEQLPQQLAQLELEPGVLMMQGSDMAAPFAALDMGRVVKGAPYCADAVHETVQWLPDGNGGAPNRITRAVTTRMCRDGDGRTRQETKGGSGTIVYLRDPVANESWMLDTDRKTARRLGGQMGDHSGDGADSSVWREYAEHMRAWARMVADRAKGHAGAAAGTLPPPPPPPAMPPMPMSALPSVPPVAAAAPVAPVPPAPPMPVVISRIQRDDGQPGDGAGGPRELRVHIVRRQGDGAGAAAGDWALAPPAVQWRAHNLAPRGPGSLSPLGIKDIDGVRASGERTTWTIDAGRVGNDKPILITREIWTAPELMVTLRSRDFDPRSGEVNYRLQNLKRGEPDAALMRVPADFNKAGRPRRGASGPTG